jgi:hypothetical protein
MGNKVYIEDFNPSSGYWNRTSIFDLEEFDKNAVYVSRYGGIVRIRYVDDNGDEIPSKKSKKEIVVEEKISIIEKPLTEEKSDDIMETNKFEKEETIGFKKKIFG